MFNLSNRRLGWAAASRNHRKVYSNVAFYGVITCLTAFCGLWVTGSLPDGLPWPQSDHHVTLPAATEQHTLPVPGNYASQRKKERRVDNEEAVPLAGRGFNIAPAVKNNCKGLTTLHTMSERQRRLLYRHMVYDDVHKLMFCYVPKAGSSNWKRVFLSLQTNGEIPADKLKNFSLLSVRSGLKFLHQLPAKVAEEKLSTYYKFMFVRNPASRIGAVYSHKFTDFPESLPFKRKYGPEIFRSQKTRASKAVSERYLKEDLSFDTKTISFTEFANYLLNTDKKAMNEHWMPTHELCQPCAVPYSFIGKFEDLPKSAEALLATRRLDNIVTYPNQALFYRSKPYTIESFRKLQDDLPRGTRHMLNILFSYDFDLFDYQIPL